MNKKLLADMNRLNEDMRRLAKVKGRPVRHPKVVMVENRLKQDAKKTCECPNCKARRGEFVDSKDTMKQVFSRLFGGIPVEIVGGQLEDEPQTDNKPKFH